MMWKLAILTAAVFLTIAVRGESIREKLIKDIINKKYNAQIVPNFHHQPLSVHFDVIMSQLINVNSQSQYVKSKLWMYQLWTDYRLTWDPTKYGNITSTHVSSEKIWLPDIVLYNNADGDYEVSLTPMTKVFYNGTVVWKTPAIYSSSCSLDVKNFPFDTQKCHMHFKSWTYGSEYVNVVNMKDHATIDPSFVPSGEWKIHQITSVKIPETSSHHGALEYEIVMTRKPLFYMTFIVLPCIFLSFLNAATFYFPALAGEKITLCISVLLALTVFLFLISKVVAPTSLGVPMIGKFITLAMSLVTVSTAASVIVLNIYFRSPSTHVMPKWFRTSVIEFLPKLLHIKRPNPNRKYRGYVSELSEFFDDNKRKEARKSNPGKRYFVQEDDFGASHPGNKQVSYGIQLSEVSGSCHMQKLLPENGTESSENIELAAASIRTLAEIMKHKDQFQMEVEDWKFGAMVIDKLFFYIYMFATVVGTVAIFF